MTNTTHQLPLFFVLFWAIGSFFQGCYYDVAEELYPEDCLITGMSYAEDVLPILRANCYRCHDAANSRGGITLEGYEQLLRQIDNGRLLGAIKRESGFSAMPQDAPKLADCQISKIEAWILEGAPDN